MQIFVHEKTSNGRAKLFQKDHKSVYIKHREEYNKRYICYTIHDNWFCLKKQNHNNSLFINYLNLTMTMTVNFLNTMKVYSLPFFAFILCAFFIVGCKSDVSMKKQQKAFYVDDKGDLLNKKGQVVKPKGEFKLEGGYYVDNGGERIQRNIDKTKEKINATVDKTKEAVSNAASKTKESVKTNFKKIFNTKAVGTTYTLEDIAFDKGSHKMTSMDKTDVEGLAAALKEHPESRIQVQVHTADGKTKADCKQLSKKRAEVVKGMLVALGVNEGQISSKGMGLKPTDAEKAVANKVEVIVEQ